MSYINNLDDIKITLLEASDYTDSLVLRTDGRQCFMSDLVPLTGGDVRDYSGTVEPYGCETLTKTKNGTSVTTYNNYKCEIDTWSPNFDWYAIRPVIEFPPELFKEITKHKRLKKTKHGFSLYEVSLGEWPMDAVWFKKGKLNNCLEELEYILNESLGEDGDERLENTKLKSTHEDYPFKSEGYGEWVPYNRISVYEYKGNKYIRIKAKTYKGKSVRLLHKKFLDGEYVWIKIRSLDWLVDEENNRLICEYNLISGMPLVTSSYYYDGDFESTNLYRYLRDAMLPSILQSVDLEKYRKVTQKVEKVEEVKKEEEVKQEEPTLNDKNIRIAAIVSEISSYKDYYLGKDNIQDRVNSLVSKYNRDIRTSSKRQNSSTLKVGFKNIDLLYSELMMNLENVLLELKTDYEIGKPYFEMIDTLEGKTENDLSKIISDIREVINNPFLEKESEELNTELTESINKYIVFCKAALELRRDHANKITYDALENTFRGELQIYINKLCTLVEKRDIINEFVEGVKNILNEQYIETKNVRVKYLLDIIKEVCTSVKVQGNASDKRKLKQLLDFHVDYSQDILTILKELNDIVKKVYAIELEINERKGNEVIVDDSTIVVDINSLFEGSNNMQREMKP